MQYLSPCSLYFCLTGFKRMLPITTLSFRLSLQRRAGTIIGCQGNYYIELTGESPFDINKNFVEIFFSDSKGSPFYQLEDAARFSYKMAEFWKARLIANPRLAITGIGELADVWKKFASSLSRTATCNTSKALAQLGTGTPIRPSLKV